MEGGERKGREEGMDEGREEGTVAEGGRRRGGEKRERVVQKEMEREGQSDGGRERRETLVRKERDKGREVQGGWLYNVKMAQQLMEQVMQLYLIRHKLCMCNSPGSVRSCIQTVL